MGRFDWFSGATGDWQARALRRLDRVVDEHGAGAREYIGRRLAATKWGTYHRRRWTFIRDALDQRTLDAAESAMTPAAPSL